MSDLEKQQNQKRRLRILVGYLLNRKIFISFKGEKTSPLIHMLTKKAELVSQSDIMFLLSNDYLDMHWTKAFYAITPKGFNVAHDRLKKSGGKITTDPNLSQKALTYQEVNAIYDKRQIS